MSPRLRYIPFPFSHFLICACIPSTFVFVHHFSYFDILYLGRSRAYFRVPSYGEILWGADVVAKAMAFATTAATQGVPAEALVPPPKPLLLRRALRLRELSLGSLPFFLPISLLLKRGPFLQGHPRPRAFFLLLLCLLFLPMIPLLPFHKSWRMGHH